MINYKIFKNANINNIENYYEELLKTKDAFYVLTNNDINYILTKERSFFEVENIEEFINYANSDIYFKTNIINDDVEKYFDEFDFNLYKNCIEKYKEELTKIYANKYMFGTIAVKTKTNSFITTIRGKQNLNSFTIVKNVNFNNNEIEVINEKATLNAPLLSYIFKNSKVKYIVHLHTFDNNLPIYNYAFPGTIRDSIRETKTSFNIKHHGVFYLFDEKGNLL